MQVSATPTFTAQQQGNLNLEEWNPRYNNASKMPLTIEPQVAEVFRFIIENNTEILELMGTWKEMSSDERSEPNEKSAIANSEKNTEA